ncbi:MAG TPA: NADH-quinone oxidoreductase subunit M [Planctomycetota bacterium]|nr:NADH-quinone oxidoreductase subunit M [Planctomycetota bacterium]
MDFPILSLFVFAPVLGMLAIFCIPAKRGDIMKTVAAAAAAVPLLIGIYLFFSFRDDGRIHYYESLPWIKGLNVYYKLGMDGISAPMVVLSGLVGFLAVVASWGIEKQVKGYFALILLLLAGMNGVFCALDFFLFYVFWEVMLLPMYFLIGIWGGPNRVYAAIKFFLYTMAGSVLMLVVLLAGWYWSDGKYLEASQPHLVLQARKAVYDYHAPLLKEVAEEEKLLKTRDPNAELGATQLAALFNKHQVDRGQVTNLRAHLNKFSGIDEAKFKAAEKAMAGNDQEAKVKALAEVPVPLDRTFDLIQLKLRYSLFLGDFTLFGSTLNFAILMFVFLYIAFAIKVPVFPFHTWLPWAHVEAPTAISVILAGILLKMGVYGFFRIAYPMFPTAAVYFAVPIGLLGVFNILYGACCALAQDDLKKIVAYSSVSHMGYCMLGMAALTGWGMTGSVLQMFNHGTSTSMMFLLVGVIYDRAHHRDVNRFGGLAAQLPVYTGLMTVALFASMGLPGLSGFISEILVFLGAFQSTIGESENGMLKVSFTSMTIVSAIGVVLTAAYLLWMMQRVFFGPLNEKYKGYGDVNARELFSLVPLVIVVVVFGIYPQPLIDLTRVSVDGVRRHVLAADERVHGSVAKAEAIEAEPLAAMPGEKAPVQQAPAEKAPKVEKKLDKVGAAPAAIRPQGVEVEITDVAPVLNR